MSDSGSAPPVPASRICPQCRTTTDDAVCPSDGFPTVDAERYRNKRANRDPLIGTIFEGRYRIEKRIGRGGMGAVYKATQLAVGRPVALKVLSAELNDNLREVARFQQEARAMSGFHHPNIVGLIDFGQSEDGRLFLVMEYLEGEPLSALMKREGPLDAKRIVQFAIQICEALGEAHDQGIVHRDLKPENLFVIQIGRKRDVIKVLDFGIAKVSGEAAAELTLTRTGAIIGSPRYMAPEQARGTGISAQTDLYALGVILYEMLTGRPVFEGKSPTDYVVAHVMEKPRPPTLDGVALTGPLPDLIMWCLAKKPEERPASAEALLNALKACADAPLAGSEPEEHGATMPLSLDAAHEALVEAMVEASARASRAGLPSLAQVPGPARSAADAPPGPALAHLPGPARPAADLAPGPDPLDTRRASNHAAFVLASEPQVGAVAADAPPTARGAAWRWVAAAAVVAALGAGAWALTRPNAAPTDPGPAAVIPTPTAAAAPAAPVAEPATAVLQPAAPEPQAAEATPPAAAPPTPELHAAAATAPEPMAADAPTPDKVAADAPTPEPQGEPAAPAPTRASATPQPQAPAPTEGAALAPVIVEAEPRAAVYKGKTHLGLTPVEVRWAADEAPPRLRVAARGFKTAFVQLAASDRGGRRRVQLEPAAAPAEKKGGGGSSGGYRMID